ncbi:transposase [Streptomyces albipurpureus]|uniref:Transposase n=1 Tax=Streptomyces albipurpureus TaxID=2897419 RepID=A0ABT0UIL5_9ACTN|nr:transposase [Streptomyces sp. CWNU-1]MCM2388289.1 transposase [Streptomyces sp. CWNU-1]
MTLKPLLTNAVIFHSALDIAEIVSPVSGEERVGDRPRRPVHIPPYQTGHIKRYGEYSTHELGMDKLLALRLPIRCRVRAPPHHQGEPLPRTAEGASETMGCGI